MKLPGIIVFAACGLASLGGARAEVPGALPLIRIDGKKARVQATSHATPAAYTPSSFQASLTAARAAAEERTQGMTQAAQPSLNRFGPRRTRVDKSVRPKAMLVPSANRATLRR